MGLFGKKKAEAKPDTTPAQEVTIEPVELGEFLEEISCTVAVSKDEKRHTLETQGKAKFYENGMTVCAQGVKGFIKDAVFLPAFMSSDPTEQMRYAYTDITRFSYPRKITARIDYRDGRFAFFVLRKGDIERFTNALAAHGISVE